MSKDKERGQLEELLYPIMTKRNMSVQSLASAVGVQRHTFYSWLYENRRPRLEMLRRIARVLNIPLAQLVAATYADVNGARLDSLLQVYLGLPEEKRRFLEAMAVFLEAENQRSSNES
ncbi:MAG TPA: helix-turn-helix transcriptional regulator [Ktedonobacteraceae bacterium]|nr:helix-turn-helix transcriptional regulator [Ktedonobacteraceae bacterium]